MLKEIMAAWQDGSLMRDAVTKLAEMIGNAEFVFNHGWETCVGQTVVEEIRNTVREHDKAVNRGERDIRRMAAEHLTINPGQDVSGCLALMLMAKDAERLGDHARNLYDIGVALEGCGRELPIFDKIEPIAKGLSDLLPQLRQAILESDETRTHQILERYQELKKEIRTASDALYASSMETRTAVSAALLLRYLRRANAHLGNIASGIIFPLENIDFVSRGLREEERER
jgi:phosphate transport system protein